MTTPLASRPSAASRLERIARALERAGRRVPGLRTVLLSPVVARPGYWFATVCGWIWGAALMLGPVSRRGGVVVCEQLPSWSFGRGGTTIGAVYLTGRNTSDAVLEHEAVHREQWRKYGLVFIVLYVAAGSEAHTNRFEIEAGLEKGGYR